MVLVPKSFLTLYGHSERAVSGSTTLINSKNEDSFVVYRSARMFVVKLLSVKLCFTAGIILTISGFALYVLANITSMST